MYSRNFKFVNGQEVKEKISGFTGVITGTCFYLTGCNQYLVTAKPKDEFSEPVSLWYDEGRLELIGDSFSAEDIAAEDNGCDKAPLLGKRGY
ncbi:hypothetical protein HZQ94_02100 [Elizabethkingia anophelis]|nr:hypothetical protein [Elizabethkingia anophelis]MCT3679047.1 hypothetical protein [Elizabethkingia anophelis]